MFNHKEDCKFKGFYKLLCAYDPNGPDSQLEISECGIIFDENIHTIDKKDFEIDFNFCPCCGVPKE